MDLSFIHSFIQHFLNVFHMLDLVPGTEDGEKQRKKTPFLLSHSLHTPGCQPITELNKAYQMISTMEKRAMTWSRERQGGGPGGVVFMGWLENLKPWRHFSTKIWKQKRDSWVFLKRKLSTERKEQKSQGRCFWHMRNSKGDSKEHSLFCFNTCFCSCS